MNLRKVAGIGAIVLLIAIVLGAFGAHGLEGKITSDQLESYRTGVLYQLIHGLGILLIAILGMQLKEDFKWVIRLQLLGVIFFSGSIYLLACKELLGMTSITKILGPITPIGGLLLIVSWGILTVRLIRK